MLKARRKPKVRRAGPKTLDQRYLGEEPTSALTMMELIRAYNWYNYFTDSKERIEYLHHYLKGEDLKWIKKIPDNNIAPHTCYMARMIDQEVPVMESSIKEWKSEISRLVQSAKLLKEEKEKEAVPEVVKKNPYQLMKDKSDELIAYLESEVDKVILGKKNDFKCYEWLLANQVPGPVASMIKDYYSPQLQDEDVTGTYKSFIQMIVDDCSTLTSNKKKTRKSRMPKPKKVEATVGKMKYLKEYHPLKLISENPTKIVGAKELWVYDTQKRTLSVFHAKDERVGFLVSGTTISDYNETTSIRKTIRKPEQFLPTFMKLTQAKLKKVMDSISGKPHALTGRMNEHMVIVKVY